MKPSKTLITLSILLVIFFAAWIPSIFADGDFFTPTKEIIVPNPASVTKTTDDWYRRRVLEIRLSWTAYIRDNPHAPNAGVNFSATNWVNMVKSSGTDILMLVVQHYNENGFLFYPSNLTDASNHSPIDYPQLLKVEVQNQGLQMGMSINAWGLRNMAAYQGQTPDYLYQHVVDEINTRYGNFLKQFWFDMFHMPDSQATNYNHLAVLQKIRASNSDADMSYNQYLGSGAEDIGITECHIGTHLWNQEDFDEFVAYRNNDWGHEFVVMLGTDWGTTDSMPLNNLLNMISRLGAMGITTALTLGPDITGQYTTDQINKLSAIGDWLIPRKPYMDRARPDWYIKVTGYSGLNYVNRVGAKRTVHLLTGSLNPQALPASIALNMSGVTGVTQVPTGVAVPFATDSNGTTISLTGVTQDQYDTILSVEGGTLVGPPTVFEDNFDAESTGANPTGYALVPPAYGTMSIQEVPTATNKSICLVDTDVTPDHGITALKVFGAITGKVNCQYRVRADQTTGGTFVELQDEAGTIAVRAGLAGNGQIRVWNNSSSTTDLQAYNVAKWFDIRIEADVATNKYDLYVNGIKKLTQASFYSPVSAIGRIELVSDYGSGTSYFDDVRIEGTTLVGPAPLIAVSRKTHGGAGIFDVPLPLSGSAGIECRRGSGANSDGHQIIVTFANPVTASSASVTSGTASVDNFSVSGTQVTANLTGVTNGQTITVKLGNVSDGTNVGDVAVSMGVLVGDVNGSAVTNATDVSETKAQSGELITGENFRTDVDANGAINSSDISLVKLQSGTGLP